MIAPNAITRTLFAYVETLTALPIYYVDSTGQPTDDHLQAFILPAGTLADGLSYDSWTQQFGILQINILVKENEGANISAGDYAETILTGLSRGLELTGIRFDRVPAVSAPVASGGFLMVSVSAEYNAIS